MQPRSFKTFNTLWLLLSTLFIVSCANVPGVIEPPKIAIQNVAIQNISLRQSSALIRLNLTNPNAFPLPLRGIDYQLRLNNRPVAGGRQVQTQNIGANQTVVITVPITLQLGEVLRLVPDVLRNGQVQYDLQGQVNLPFIGIPFNRKGITGIRP